MSPCMFTHVTRRARGQGACVRACMCACVLACVRACVRVYMVVCGWTDVLPTRVLGEFFLTVFFVVVVSQPEPPPLSVRLNTHAHYILRVVTVPPEFSLTQHALPRSPQADFTCNHPPHKPLAPPRADTARAHAHAYLPSSVRGAFQDKVRSFAVGVFIFLFFCG